MEINYCSVVHNRPFTYGSDYSGKKTYNDDSFRPATVRNHLISHQSNTKSVNIINAKPPK